LKVGEWQLCEICFCTGFILTVWPVRGGTTNQAVWKCRNCGSTWNTSGPYNENYGVKILPDQLIHVHMLRGVVPVEIDAWGDPVCGWEE